MEPHVPLVKDPVDPRTVPPGQNKRIPGIQAATHAAEDARSRRTAQSAVRKRLEEGFGWLKSVAKLGPEPMGEPSGNSEQMLQIGAAAYGTVRLRDTRPTLADSGGNAAGLKDHQGVRASDEKDPKPLEHAVFPQPVSASPQLTGDVEMGWVDAKDRDYRLRFIKQCGFSADPHWQRMMSQFKYGPTLAAVDRAQVIDDHEWYRSVHYNEFRRPARSDSSLYFGYTMAEHGPDVILAFALTRTLNDREFTEHDRQFCYWLLHEIRPLVGKQLAAPGESSGAKLPTRLQQTLQCLLEGDSEKQAAVRLGISKATVHEYVTALYRHFKVNSRGELLARCLRPNHGSG
ncbi:MAG: LuxR C-terminal-related transcriptional regulator [Gemmataceae bacterium]